MLPWMRTWRIGNQCGVVSAIVTSWSDLEHFYMHVCIYGVSYKTHKITATTMSTTVAELHGLMCCYGSALFLRGPWSDITGEIADVHIRTDAKNLVTTASTTHQPEQKETMHLIQMLREEGNSGQMHDLAHVLSEDCLSKAR